VNPDLVAAGIVEPRLRGTLLSEHATRLHKTRSNAALPAAPIRPTAVCVARGLLLIERSSHAHEPTLPTTKKAPIRQICSTVKRLLRSTALRHLALRRRPPWTCRTAPRVGRTIERWLMLLRLLPPIPTR
jgi:hypothetical protein